VSVGTLVVNKYIDDFGDYDRCLEKHAVQADALKEIHAALPELDVLTIPDQHGDVTGLTVLERPDRSPSHPKR
jgi:arsenite-transporting ATPase